MNKKGFNTFKNSFKGSGSNPLAFAPYALLAGLAYLMKDAIYYGKEIIIQWMWVIMQ